MLENSEQVPSQTVEKSSFALVVNGNSLDFEGATAKNNILE